ncbi:MAG: succinate dehydrogenase, cytochrome b556 subunit [Calditrichaeota bacterium]|nr:succinate dehydrogenase, cytochrome b556 subunit [Calditrichota bacterium]
MKVEVKHRKNKLGIIGWIGGGRFGAERYAYALHRLTGLGILAYFLLHIFVTGSRIGGQQSWQNAVANFETPIFKFGEFLVFLAFAYHALNGLRLIITELGFMLGKAQRPVFPYVTSVHRQRPLFIGVMIVAAIIIIFGGADFYFI